MSALEWLYGAASVKYRCPFHGDVDVKMAYAAKYPEQTRCPLRVRVSGLSSGGSGPDNGHDTVCGMSARLL